MQTMSITNDLFCKFSVEQSNSVLLKNHKGTGTVLPKEGFHMPAPPPPSPAQAGHLSYQLPQMHFILIQTT